MSKPLIDNLLQNHVSWLADSGPEDDIAISSRIRYARNLENLPFPIHSDADVRKHVMDSIRVAVEKSNCFKTFYSFQIKEIEKLDRQILLERRLISREFMASHEGSALFVNGNEELGIMVNEEDHIRMQAMKSGFQLREVLNDIDKIDDKLSKELAFAFNNELGYLTSCPTNVGTGMRASVMLHLPGLVLEGQINAVIQGVNKLGLAVRGILGEGSDNLGNFYQVSNQSTLGETESQIVERLENVIRQIISHEKNARQKLLEKRQNFLLDHVGRAYGILRHAYILSSEETLNSLSALRLGVDMGMFSSVDIHTVNELFVIIQPAHLQKYAGKTLSSKERDVIRANIVRERLKGVDKKGKD